MLSPEAEKESIRVGPDRPEVSIVCPVFNEKEIVPKLLDLFQQVLSTLDRSYELIMVDDGSQDGTLELLKTSLGIIPDLKIVQLYRNYGQVAAASAGMSIAKGDWIIMLDGDLQHDPSDIARLVAEISNGFDMVATYRSKREETALRLLITFVANRVNRFATGVKVKDFGSGYRLFSARILDMITDARGYVHYNTPALYLYARAIVEIPIVQSRREHGSSKWTFNQFILFNLDFFLHSKKAIQVLLSLGFLGIFIGASMYVLCLLGLGVAKSISAPITICFTSFLSFLLAVIWREVLQTQRFALGLPDFLIAAIWAQDKDNKITPILDATVRADKPLTALIRQTACAPARTQPQVKEIGK